MSARLIDVAARAGVSRATASRVIAGTPRNVSAELIARVEHAAEELGYRTNHAARALRTGSTGTYGVIVPSLANPYFVQLVGALSARVRGSGGVLVVSDAEDDPAAEAEQINTLANGKVDGLIIAPVSRKQSGKAIRQASKILPVVLFDRQADRSGTTTIAMDDAAAIDLLLDYLKANGRENVALVVADQDTSAASERLAAFRSARGRHAPVVLLPSITTDAGRIAGNEILTMGRVNAVICAADVLAVGLVTTLQRSGVAIPEQIMVTGFDDTPVLTLLNPPLTSIQHPLDAMTERALDLLASPAEVRGERVERFAPTLVIRDEPTP